MWVRDSTPHLHPSTYRYLQVFLHSHMIKYWMWMIKLNRTWSLCVWTQYHYQTAFCVCVYYRNVILYRSAALLPFSVKITQGCRSFFLWATDERRQHKIPTYMILTFVSGPFLSHSHLPGRSNASCPNATGVNAHSNKNARKHGNLSVIVSNLVQE